jgi:hypothetical protein
LEIVDSQTLGAMLVGLEFVSELITRNAMLENLYLRAAPVAQGPLGDSITRLYTFILQYLSNAKRYYSQSSASESTRLIFYYVLCNVLIYCIGRMAKSILQPENSDLDVYIRKISEEQDNINTLVRLMGAGRK